MRKLNPLLLGTLLLTLVGCSLPPEIPVSKEQLYKTGVYSYYTIKESPERVLAALNRDGEVVLEAFLKDRPVYIKIMALTSGLQVYYYDR